MKGAIIGMLIFMAFIIPLLLTIILNTINQNAFMKMTTEFSSLVEESGGLTENIATIKGNLSQTGYDIELTNLDGDIVNEKQPVGETIVVHYEYTFRDVFKTRILTTNDYITVQRR